MIGLSDILNSGKSGLFASQYGLSVIANNIANVNTPGYSRQSLVLETDTPMNVVPGPLGTGVRVDEIQRASDQIIEAQLRNQLSLVGQWDKSNTLLQGIESVLNEPSTTGLSQALSDFFNAWSDVSNNPDSTSPRMELVQKAQALAGDFQGLKTQLQTSISSVNDEVSADVNTINTKAGQIAQLNSQIVQAETNGQKANDLRDKRDTLVEDLSKLANIQTVESNDGSLAVYINYKVIVNGTNTVALSTQTVNRGGSQMTDILYNGDTLIPQSGELQGALNIRNEKIPEYMSKLDTLADSIITGVNNLHRNGYGLDGSTGNDFFSGTNASSISVNTVITSNLSEIAASTKGPSGDGSNALQISNLANSFTMDNGKSTFTDFYGNTISDIGSASATSSTTLDNENTLLAQLQRQKSSISAVSLDEEYTNMINYQQSYQAAAKVITMANSLYATMMGMVGVTV